MSWLSSFLHPQRGYDAAKNALQQYFNQSQQYLSPYVQQGQGAYTVLNNAMQELLNPTALLDKFSKSYKESDVAKSAEASAKEHGLNALSAMGLLGSTPGAQAIQAGTADIAAQDKENFLNKMLNEYLQGLGIAGNIYQTGAQAGSQLGQQTMNMGRDASGLEYMRTNAPGQAFGQGAGLIGNILSNYLTGGFGKGRFGRGAWSFQ